MLASSAHSSANVIGALPATINRLVRHRNADAALGGDFMRAVVASVGVPDHTHAGVVGQDTLQLLAGERGAVGDAQLPGVYRAPDAGPTAVVDADPGCARGRVDQSVQHRAVH